MVEEGGGRGQEPELLSQWTREALWLVLPAECREPAWAALVLKRPFQMLNRGWLRVSSVKDRRLTPPRGEGDRAGPCDVGLEGPQRNQGWLWGFKSPHLGRGAGIQGNGER